MTAPAKLPADKLVTPCQGTGTLIYVTAEPRYRYVACPGCPQCSTDARVARLLAAPPAADPFAGVPTYVADEEM